MVGEGIRLVGDLEGDGEIQIWSVVEGSVTCSRLVIGAGGLVKGEVTANEAEVNGDFQGRMEVRLLVGGPTGSLSGELKYKEMSISTGCLIAGHLEQTHPSKGSQGLGLNEEHRGKLNYRGRGFGLCSILGRTKLRIRNLASKPNPFANTSTVAQDGIAPSLDPLHAQLFVGGVIAWAVGTPCIACRPRPRLRYRQW